MRIENSSPQTRSTSRIAPPQITDLMIDAFITEIEKAFIGSERFRGLDFSGLLSKIGTTLKEESRGQSAPTYPDVSQRLRSAESYPYPLEKAPLIDQAYEYIASGLLQFLSRIDENSDVKLVCECRDAIRSYKRWFGEITGEELDAYITRNKLGGIYTTIHKLLESEPDRKKTLAFYNANTRDMGSGDKTIQTHYFRFLSPQLQVEMKNDPILKKQIDDEVNFDAAQMRNMKASLSAGEKTQPLSCSDICEDEWKEFYARQEMLQNTDETYNQPSVIYPSQIRMTSRDIMKPMTREDWKMQAINSILPPKPLIDEP